MHNDRRDSANFDRLPKESVHRLTAPFARFLRIEAAGGAMLLACTVAALLLSNSPWARPFLDAWETPVGLRVGSLEFARSLKAWINDGVFMLSSAIVDDIGAILVVASGYSSHIAWGALAQGALGIGAVRIMALVGIRSVLAYFLMGCSIWLAVDASGIHATITGVMLGLLTPARRWVSDQRLYAILGRVIAHPSGMERSGATKDRHTLHTAERAARESLSPAERVQMALHPWVGFVVMPVFALANAGMPLTTGNLGNSVTVAIVIGFTFGKPIGVLSFSWLAVRLGIAIRPAGLSWALLTGGSLLAGIGFTMALFIANLAFDETLIDHAKLGIFLASVFSAAGGLALLTWVSAGRRLRQVDPD